MLRLGGVAGGGAGNKSLAIVQSLLIVDIGNIFRELKSLSRSQLALAQVCSMRLESSALQIQGFSSIAELDHCFRLFHAILVSISANASEAFVFDRRGDDGLLDLQEWNEMMDWSLVDVHVGDRKNLKGSLYTRIVDEQIVFLEEVELEYQSALLHRSSLFDLGLTWMMQEEWRDVARSSADPTAFSLLNNYMKNLKNLIEVRQQGSGSYAYEICFDQFELVLNVFTNIDRKRSRWW